METMLLHGTVNEGLVYQGSSHKIKLNNFKSPSILLIPVKDLWGIRYIRLSLIPILSSCTKLKTTTTSNDNNVLHMCPSALRSIWGTNNYHSAFHVFCLHISFRVLKEICFANHLSKIFINHLLLKQYFGWWYNTFLS